MSNVEDLQALIAAEAEHAEATMNDPIPAAALARATRPNRANSVAFTLRLNPDELAAVERLADVRDIPAATLVRGWIVRQLAAERATPTDATAAAYSRALLDEPHVPAEPDPGIAAVIERVGRAITGDHDRDGRELATDEPSCPRADETS